jgi:hypothetical protein
MSHRFPALARAACAGLLCLVIAPLVTACNSSSSAAAPAGSSAAASTAPAKAASSPASVSAASGFSTSCPSAAAVSTAIGSTYPAPKSQPSSGEGLCTYTNANGSLVVTMTPATGLSMAGVKIAMAAQAKAQSAKLTAVSGLGEAAYYFPLPNSGGGPSITLGALSSSTYVVVVSDAAPAPTEAVARLFLAE